MINLRYHIVSLTAVFLALGIGVLLGGTYLDKYTVDQLDQNIKSAEARIRETRSENDRLRGQIGDATARNQALVDAGIPQFFRDRLTDVPVLVIASDGIDEASRKAVIRTLAATGADFRGTLTITDRFDLDAARAKALAGALAIEATSPIAIRQQAVAKFAAALAAAAEPATGGPGASSTTVPGSTTTASPTTAAPTTAPDPGAFPTTTTTGVVVPPEQPDVLTALLTQGLLSFEAPPSLSSSGPLLSGTGYRYLFLSGPEPAVPDSTVILPVLRFMANAGPVPAVVASAAVGDDPAGTRDVVVARVLAENALSRSVSTVDDLESFNGLAATILALDEVGRGVHGHYGEGRGATAPLPGGP